MAGSWAYSPPANGSDFEARALRSGMTVFAPYVGTWRFAPALGLFTVASFFAFGCRRECESGAASIRVSVAAPEGAIRSEAQSLRVRVLTPNDRRQSVIGLGDALRDGSTSFVLALEPPPSMTLSGTVAVEAHDDEQATGVALAGGSRVFSLAADTCVELEIGLRSFDASSCAVVRSSCGDAFECCSGRCENERCQAIEGCKQEHQSCADASECCSNVCAGEGAGKECRTTGECMAEGSTCEAARDCCSLGCDVSSHNCVAGDLCKVSGDICDFDGQCCGGACERTTSGGAGRCADLPPCRVSGERCSISDDCCSNVCAALGGVNRCNPLRGCRVAGEVCSVAADCCSGACTRTSSSPVSRCAGLGGCRVAGELCSLTSDCCSNVCRSDGAANRCLFSGGCRVAGELCALDEDCCSRACREDGLVRRCTLLSGCKPTGENCSLTSECCSGRCQSGGAGSNRCQ